MVDGWPEWGGYWLCVTETEETEQGLFWGHLLWASVPRLVAGYGACRSVACCAVRSRKLSGRRLPGQMERGREEGEAGQCSGETGEPEEEGEGKEKEEIEVELVVVERSVTSAVADVKASGSGRRPALGSEKGEAEERENRERERRVCLCC